MPGDDRIKKSATFIMCACILSVMMLTGCTAEDHRVMVTVKNLRDVSQNIQLHIDGSNEFTATVGPGASVEREFELAPATYTFELYQDVEGTYELYKTETLELESDSSVFFELE